MKTRLSIYYFAAAAILAATITTAAHAQEADPLADVTKAAATPAPTAATATPKPTAQAPASTPRAATTAAPKSTPAPAAPRETVKDQLAKGHFVSQGDLSSMAGKKTAPATFLVGQFKFSGPGPGGRKEFVDGGLFGAGKTKLLVRFPVAPDPRVLVAGSATKWEKAAPLRVESVASGKDGITAYCTDVTP